MAAEYILKEGNPNVMLCERGIRTFETGLPLHARPDGRAGAQGALAPAGDRRSQPRRRAGASSCCRCPSPRPPRAPTASSSRCTPTPTRPSATGRRRCRTPSPSTPLRSSALRHWPGRRSAPSDGRPADACSSAAGRPIGARPLKVAVLGVGLIGGSMGLAARARAGARCAGMTPIPQRARGRSSWGRSIGGASTSPRRSRGRRSFSSPRPWARLRTPSHRRSRTQGRTVLSATSVRPSSRWTMPADDPRFFGGHPLAGAETTGVAHAREDMFEGASWYLTADFPTKDPDLLDRLLDLIGRLGAHPRTVVRRGPRPPHGLHLAPPARVRQRPCGAGAGRLRTRGLQADRRSQLARCDPGRRRQHRGLDRHIPRQRPCVDRRHRRGHSGTRPSARDARRGGTPEPSRPGTSARRRPVRRCSSDEPADPFADA